VKIGKVFLNQYATDKLVEAVENQGFEPVLCTSDADFKPLLIKTNKDGKGTIFFGVETGFSVALKNSLVM
jgi:uncharacterized LabA/DUF88 family protein